MIKYEIKEGEIKELKFNGDVTDLAADTMMLIVEVYKAILGDTNEKSAEIAGLYRSFIVNGMQEVLPKVFIDNLIKTCKKQKKPATTQEKHETEVDNFADDFLRFLYGADDQ